MEIEEEKLDLEKIKKEIIRNLKENKYLLVLSILTAFFLMFLLLNILGIKIINSQNFIIRFLNYFINISKLLTSSQWATSFVALIISSILAYYKKFKIAIIILLIWIIFFGASARLLNLGLLKDSTTGNYIPLALDPYYFLRAAETMISEGGLPAYDSMRNPTLHIGFIEEILPETLVFMYKVSKVFNNNITLGYIDVVYPVVFFILGMTVFFILIWILTKSKVTALLSSLILATIPAYLYRTMAGFADHEAIGMFGFFLTLLVYIVSLNIFEKRKASLKKSGLLGGLLGLVTAFTIAGWSGVANFLFLIIPLSFLLYWIVIYQKPDQENKNKLLGYILFYVCWIIFSILFSNIFGFAIIRIVNKYIINANGIASVFALGFIIIDSILIWKKELIKKENLRRYRVVITFVLTLILGTIFLTLIGKSIISMVQSIINRFVTPFSGDRIGLTVAESKQPYLTDWVSQSGQTLFALFVIGMIFIGTNLSKGIRKLRKRFFFSVCWIIMVFGILFSRTSQSSLLNGTNLVSKIVFFGSLLLFLGYFISVYFREEIRFKKELLIMSILMFTMLIAGRGAIRFFFVVTPFVSLMVAYTVFNLCEGARKSKDEVFKLLFIIASIITIILLISNIINFTGLIIQQARYTGPSANYQWQNSMKWVRENTGKNEIFVHWWDYGYWVQYLGQRATITDGGHKNTFWDHLIGRYVLTTPYPETALSFMKAHNVSYLLIDPTDIGKYPAYSSIGSDEEGNDRLAWIPTVSIDANQIQETRNGSIRTYQNARNGQVSLVPLDGDIVYDNNGTQIFLPEGRAGLMAVVLETINKNNSLMFKQPEGIYFDNGNQYKMPLRYLSFNQETIDYEQGLNVTIKLVPRVYQDQQGRVQVDNLGLIMYLSPKTMNSLFAQLYLLGNKQGLYENFELVSSTQDPNVEYLNTQGANLNGVVYFNGARGPINIWKIRHSDEIISREEFLRENGEYAEFDDLQYLK